MMSDGKERARCFAVAPSPSLTQPHTHLGLARRDGAVHGGGGVGGHGGKAKREGSSAARWERETPGRCGEKRRVRKPSAVSKTFFSTTRPPLHTRATHTRVTRTHTHTHNGHHRLSPSPHSPVRPRRPRLPGGRGQTASAAYDDVAAGAAGELLFFGGETEGSVLLVHANARYVAAPVWSLGGKLTSFLGLGATSALFNLARGHMRQILLTPLSLHPPSQASLQDAPEGERKAAEKSLQTSVVSGEDRWSSDGER